MAKIICITSGLTGILNSSFELLARLKADGHSIIYASPKNVKEKVIAHGIPYIQLPPIKQHPGFSLPHFKEPMVKLRRFLYKISNASKRRKEALDDMYPAEFSKFIAKESPDLLIVDIELHEYIFHAYSQKQSFVLLSQWFSLWKREGLPYLLHDTIPGQGLAGKRNFIRISWLMIYLQRWFIFAKQKVFSVGTDRRTILQDLAKKEGFPFKYIKENYWPGPFTYAELPVISMTAQEMEFPHNKRPNLSYVGPMIYENRVDHFEQKNSGISINDALAYKVSKDASLIYCTISTLSLGDINFIKKLILAVAKRKDWVLIVSLGGLERTKLPKTLPKNIFVFSYTPQLKVLKHTDCSVNHGGIHTINECIHFKVPMLVYSGKRSDQNGCAARVAYHNLGIMADKEKDEPIDIERNINKILTDNTYKEKIAGMHLRYVTYKQERRLENKIREFLPFSISKKEAKL